MQVPPLPSPPGAPERVGRYEILLPIASGGMATVFLARARGDFGFERNVAVKLVHHHLRTDVAFRDLVEEAKLAARIAHPNVVPVLDVGEDAPGVYIVLEYVEGDALSGLLWPKGGRGARAGVAVRALADALAGLHAAHELRDADGRPAEVVHRDFSPQNVLVGMDGTARLADFGIAKAIGREGHTRTGMIKGKLAYMSPEQVRGKDLDRRTDVWAAGVIAWELFARRKLYEGMAEAALLRAVALGEPPRLRQIDPDIPAAIEEVVAQALVFDPRRRCPTAAAFARALGDACDAAGIDVADREEVAAEVARLAGPRLAERRRAAAQRAKEAPSAASPAARPAPVPEAETARLDTAVQRPTRTEVMAQPPDQAAPPAEAHDVYAAATSSVHIASPGKALPSAWEHRAAPSARASGRAGLVVAGAALAAGLTAGALRWLRAPDGAGLAAPAAPEIAGSPPSAPVSSVPAPSMPVSSVPVPSMPVSSVPVPSMPVSSVPVSSVPAGSSAAAAAEAPAGSSAMPSAIPSPGEAPAAAAAKTAPTAPKAPRSSATAAAKPATGGKPATAEDAEKPLPNPYGASP